jgi:diguanylate cyclase (GGDEF)-like protein/PAS domain S-box-containing protein
MVSMSILANPMTPIPPSTADGIESVRSGSVGRARPTASPSHRGSSLSPSVLAYLMGPFALVVVLFLMHFHAIRREPVWLWLAVFVATPLLSVAADRCYGRRRNPFSLHARVACQAAGLTMVIYLTGWGPVLTGAYAFLALENVSRSGSRVWRVTALWSLIGIAVGQFLISEGWAPSELSVPNANALATMGAFILVFVIRMAGATMGQKEGAEASMRLSEDRFRSLIQNSSDVTMVTDEGGKCTFVSPAIQDLTGVDPGEFIGNPATEFVHPDDRDRVRDRLGDQFQSGPVTTLVQFRMGRVDRRWCEVEAVVSNQLDRPSVGGYVANIRDITERKEFEAILAHRALHDPLTGLANRQLILDRAEQMLSRVRRTFDPAAAYFIDLDNFKDANDSLGHDAGDKLLQAVAARLSGMLRPSDTVGRLGGDEFVLLVEGVSLATGPDVVAERIREALREPFRIDGYDALPISVTASIGIATGHRQSAQELLRDADIALYRAKAAGRNSFAVFEPAMQSEVVDRLELRSDLDAALDREQYFLLYQPILDLDGLVIRGVEALIRWRHPQRGTIPPDDFIPLLEESGQIIEVGRWVLGQACAQAQEWHRQGHPITVSVNVSMRQLESDRLVGDVEAALSRSGLPASSLTLEITESTLMRDARVTVSRLQELKEIGVSIAIDDFGTGYSSMAYLRQFPVDILKIDRSFVADMSDSPGAHALVHTLVELGRTLGLVTLAEGIEVESQLEGLRRERCEIGQGYMFSRPVPPAVVERLLHGRTGTGVPVASTAPTADQV